MPYSFTKIEKDKSNVIHYAFIFLSVFYFVSIWFILFLIKNYPAFESYFSESPIRVPWEHFDLLQLLLILVGAVMLATLQWLVTAHGLIDRISNLIEAKDANPDDEVEKMFINIVDEVSVATGGVKLRPMVINSMGLNACAYADGSETPVIAVTKGLLYKMTRAQIETVVAHEAAHIVSTDCESTTLISSMFEAFSAFLTGAKYVFDGSVENYSEGSNYDLIRTHRYSRDDDGIGGGAQLLRLGPVILFIIMLIIVIFIINLLAKCMRMFISRQREYRADAIAVRLTRDPLSLAEALYIISNHRRKMFSGADAFESMFIINPRLNWVDEDIGIFPDLFSTHPPARSRIKILLDMCQTPETVLEASLKVSRQKEEELERELKRKEEAGNQWFVQNENGEWLGPWPIKELMAMSWVKPNMLVKKMGTQWVVPLVNIGLYVAIDNPHQIDESLICPACSAKLEQVEYELLKVLKCTQCSGMLLNENQIGTTLQRRIVTFDQRIQDMAEVVEKERLIQNNNATLNICRSDRQYKCEQCKHNPQSMVKRLFNGYYHIEVDKCMNCGITWFDKDELEIMQCLYEKRDRESRQI